MNTRSSNKRIYINRIVYDTKYTCFHVISAHNRHLKDFYSWTEAYEYLLNIEKKNYVYVKSMSFPNRLYNTFLLSNIPSY